MLTTSMYMLVKIQDYNKFFKNEDFYKAHIAAGVIYELESLEFSLFSMENVNFCFVDSGHYKLFTVRWKCHRCEIYF